MAGKAFDVEIPGLDAFVRDLGRFSKDIPKAVAAANREISREVRDDARSKAQGVGPQQAKAAKALKAKGDRRGAKVRLDASGRYPFALGAEFGSRQYAQFPPWRGNQWSPAGDADVGYFLHPAIRDARDDIVDTYGDRIIDHAARLAFPD